MHCLALLLISIYVITNWIWKFFPVSNSYSEIKDRYQSYLQQLSKCQDFEYDLKHRYNIDFPEHDVIGNKDDKKSLYYELIPISVLLIFYVIYGIV